jgi:hypothetical protein
MRKPGTKQRERETTDGINRLEVKNHESKQTCKNVIKEKNRANTKKYTKEQQF